MGDHLTVVVHKERLMMIRKMRWLIAASVCWGCASAALDAQPPNPKPEVWMMPPASADGRALKELFSRPDEWQETRSRIDVLGYADHVLNRQFTDEQLRLWLPRLKQWHLKLGLEVGAVKPWGITAQKTFDAQRPMWDRFSSLGGSIDALAMDEPLCCVQTSLKQSTDYAVEQTAQFIALVRAHYPEVRLGDIEPYPSLSLAELTAWIDALEARLKQMNVRGLDFFRVDVDWCHFTLGGRIHPGNWPEVKKLEAACRQRKMAFSLIYWAADYPALDRLKLADDSTWYVSLMRQGNDYAFVGGSPDQYVIESWIGAPSRTVPETEEWTFTRSVRDFSSHFLKR